MELLIDPEIRQWVFLPIVLLTFLVDMVRYYVAIIVSIENNPNLMQIQDSQALLRARLVRENGGYLTKESFHMRKVFFNHNETGYFKCQKRSPPCQNTSSMLNDMLKGNLVNVLPMVLVGGWINWMFSGFVTTRVPFPLTLRFKPMLQRGIELAALDASWVSSASWYFLNVFGLRSIYSLVLDIDYDFDWTQRHVDVINMAAITMTQDTRSAFKAEWETLELTTHCDELCHAMREVMASAIIFAYFQ